MTQASNPSLKIALLLSIGLLVSLFFFMSSLSLLLAMIAGEGSFTFGNEFFIQCISFTLVIIEAYMVSKAVHLDFNDASELYMLKSTSFTNILLAAIIAVSLTFPLSEIDNYLQSILPPTELEKQMMTSVYTPPNFLEKIFVILSIMVAAPVGEEMLFRGAMFSLLKKTGGKIPAILITAFLFGISHMFVPRSAILILVVGVVFAILVEFTKSTYTSISAHAFFNAFPIVANWIGFQITGYNIHTNKVSHINPLILSGSLVILVLTLYLLYNINSKGKEKKHDS